MTNNYELKMRFRFAGSVLSQIWISFWVQGLIVIVIDVGIFNFRRNFFF